MISLNPQNELSANLEYHLQFLKRTENSCSESRHSSVFGVSIFRLGDDVCQSGDWRTKMRLLTYLIKHKAGVNITVN